MKLRPAVLIAVAGLAVAGCGTDGGSEAEPARDVAAETVAPPYEITKGPGGGEGPGYITATVATNASLREVFDAVRDRYFEDERGYHVQIHCSKDAHDGRPIVLGSGRFAVGSLGAAQTGLEDGGAEFKAFAGRACPPRPRTAIEARDAAATQRLFRKAANREAADFESGRLSVDRAMSARVARLLVARCDSGKQMPRGVCRRARAEAGGR